MAAEHSNAEKAHFSRAMAKLHKGGLHRALNVPEDQPIPMEKKQAAANSPSSHVRAMAHLALAMSHWKHGSK